MKTTLGHLKSLFWQVGGGGQPGAGRGAQGAAAPPPHPATSPPWIPEVPDVCPALSNGCYATGNMSLRHVLQLQCRIWSFGRSVSNRMGVSGLTWATDTARTTVVSKRFYISSNFFQCMIELLPIRGPTKFGDSAPLDGVGRPPETRPSPHVIE